MDTGASANSLLKKTMEGDGGNNENAQKNAQPLVSLLECPVCFDVSVPILQCSNGHIICEICWGSLGAMKCPTCRILMSAPTRNRALEQIVFNLNTELPCKFAVYGCPKKMLFPQKETHQATCQFKSYDCPLVAYGCKWAGRLTDIVEHLHGNYERFVHVPGFLNAHSVPVLYGESATFIFATDPDVERQTHLGIQIQSCLDAFFLVAFKTTYADDHDSVVVGPAVGKVEYSALVQHVGLKEETKKFAYRMELERDGRRLSWEAVPLSMSEGMKPSFDKGDCLSFNFKTMLLFKCEHTDMIRINVTINEI